MNLNKQDFALAIIAVGMTENLKEADKVATVIAGQFVTSPKEEQKEFLIAAKEAAAKSVTMLQQLDGKLDEELLAHAEGAQQ